MIFKLKIVTILFLIIVVIGAIYIVNHLSSPSQSESNAVIFDVKRGEGVNQISANLYQKGLIKNKFIFESYIWFKGAEAKLLAGSYQLDVNMSPKEIFNILSVGATIDSEVVITIIEGWRAEEMAQYLADKRLVTEEDFLQAIEIGQWRSQYDFLQTVTAGNVEGFLFPDTYRVFPNATAEDIIKKMLNNFNQKVNSNLRDEISRQNKTIFEVVNLASIVEREAMTKQDKKMVAGVFLNRLAINMGLESDATINYITGKSRLRPSYADLDVDSSYNTYKYRGLPPGPIANPGLDAIEAVVYPENHNYYFFLMDLSGNTHYGRTFQDHQQNVKQYLD